MKGVTDEELAAIRARDSDAGDQWWRFDLSFLTPIGDTIGDDTRRVEIERKGDLVVTAGTTTVIQMHGDLHFTEPHLSSWFRSVTDRRVLLGEVERLNKLVDRLIEMVNR